MSAEQTFRAALRLNAEAKPAEAAVLIAAAAAAGFPPALHTLAGMHANGHFAAYDPPAAFTLLDRGRRLGDARCAIAQAAFHARGFGCASDWDAALAVLADFAARGEALALRELGMLALLRGGSALAGPCLVASAADHGAAHGDLIAKALLHPSLQALGKGQSEAALMARANMPIAALNNRPVFDADELAGALDVDAAAALARAPLRPPNFEWRNSAPRVGCAPAAVSPLVCDYLILSAAPMMQAARSFNPAAGRAQISSYRTGAAASLGLMQETPALVAVRELLCACAGAGAERGEFLAIISYQPGQEYKAHFDSLLPDAAASGSAFAAGGQRTHTVLINLNEAFTGGETVFPTLNLTVSPRTGQIILFDNTDAAGARHPGALHLGARVNSGVKWLASQWVRQQAYRPDIDRGSAGP